MQDLLTEVWSGVRERAMLNWQESYRLSRFVLLHPDEDGLVLESPLTTRRFPVQGPSVIRLLLALTRPVRLESLLSAVEESQRASLRSFLEVCHDAGLLTCVHDDGSTEEETSSLGYWEFHDLLFHSRSRLGRNPHAIGGTYRLKNRLPPEPALREDLPSGSISLPRPTNDGVEACSLADALERRRSGYGLAPFDVGCLGAFLYRTCRITQRLGQGDDAVIKKVYPSGGSLHPLTVYAAISSCRDCPSGLYRYHDLEHALIPIRGFDSSVQRLLFDARDSAGGLPGMPPVLLVVSARFRRTAWKYESIAYRLILLETGALFQTMYLVASAIGLSACALGCGDSDHFARTIGSDYYQETSVGEFLLGSPSKAG